MSRAKILSASAGSGKTYQLAYKYVRDVIVNPPSYRNILAVTFTNKATREMKSRILREINNLASGDRSDYMTALCREPGLDEHTVRERARTVRTNILHDYSRFTVLTIDTFFQRILRAFILELGIELDYTIELDPTGILEKSTDALIEEINNNRELQQWLVEFMQERMDEDKRWDIREGILELGAKLFDEQNKEYIRNAGSKADLKKIVSHTVGRARAAKEKIATLAKQAIAQIDAAGLTASDFRKDTASYLYAVAGQPTKAPTKTARQCAVSPQTWHTQNKQIPAALADNLTKIMAEICDTYDRNVKRWNTADMLRANYRSFALLNDLYDKVVEMCDEENLMLLSETKYILSKFIAGNDAPFIYEKVGTRYDRFMIDEFQDTSRKEWENFLPLLHNAMSQTTDTSVLIVGDVKQSIYRWRGGDWKILQRDALEALGKDTEVASLQDNYRSLPVIVDFNNDVIGRVVKYDNDLLNAQLDDACNEGKISVSLKNELHDTLSNAYADHRQNAKKGEPETGYVDITLYDEDPPVIERIKTLLDIGYRPKDIMILTRRNSEGNKIADVLLDFMHDNKDPRYRFDIMTQEALIIGGAPVVRFVIAVLSMAVNADDNVERSIFWQFRGSDSFGEPLPEEDSEFIRSLRLLSPEEAFERLTMHYALGDAQQYTAYLQALHELIVRFCSGKRADIGAFLQWWEESGYKKSLSIEQSETTIEISTIHKAKGLEKKVVIIPYCNWELNPKSPRGQIKNFIWSQPKGDEQIAAIGNFPVIVTKEMENSYFSEGFYNEKVQSHLDSINMLYVAFTRAVESLHIFIKQPSRNSSSVDTVGKLLLATLGADKFVADADGYGHMKFGKFAPPVRNDSGSGEKIEHTVIEKYTTTSADMRLRLPSQRYFEDGDTADLAPRNFGILMHKAFSQARNTDDIYHAVRQMERDAVINTVEAEKLKREIDRALSNDMVKSWFEDDWTEIRNESDIVVPKSGYDAKNASVTRRPDRVMVKGRRAIVVDYKFGEVKKGAYDIQIQSYMRYLHDMGYTETAGYLWYVKLGDIERVPYVD